MKSRLNRVRIAIVAMSIILLGIVSCDESSSEQTAIQSSLLPEKSRNESLTSFTHSLVEPTRYDRHFRPVPVDGGPTDVYACYHIDSFGPIDVMRMDFSAEIVLHLRWIDRRLAFRGHDDRLVLSQLLDRVWRPDVFFQNAKSIVRHDLPSRNFLLWLWPNGTLLLSQKLQLRLHCPMNLKDFPFDVQTCAMKMTSFGMSTDDLMMHWANQDNESGIAVDGVAFTSEIATFLNQYYPPLCNYTTETIFSLLTGRNFSYLHASFTLKRRQSSYLINDYLPSIFIVLITWSSFAIDYNAAPARVSLSILSLLALLTETVAMERKLPPVSYITALGIWHICCIAFIHLSLLEYMAINLLKRRQERHSSNAVAINERRERRRLMKSEVPKPTIGLDDIQSVMIVEDNGTGTSVRRRTMFFHSWHLTPATLDLIFLFSYPTAFALFNVVYWCVIIPKNAVRWD